MSVCEVELVRKKYNKVIEKRPRTNKVFCVSLRTLAIVRSHKKDTYIIESTGDTLGLKIIAGALLLRKKCKGF